MSHPAWVCGLKQSVLMRFPVGLVVTPCVGVWIETNKLFTNIYISDVTPCVGVWIETTTTSIASSGNVGHTLRGCVD